MNYIRSPMNYTGGKYKLLNTIIPAFPEKIDNFVDLFCGGLNVGINVNANTVYANDQINYIIDLYKYFQQTDTKELIDLICGRIKQFNLSPDNKDAYLQLRDHYNKDKDILDLFILTCFSYNHQIRFNSKHEFNTSFGMRSYNDQIEQNLIEFCTALRSKNFVFSTSDFRDFDFSVLHSGDLVYCDPPYSISTAAYNDGKRGFNGWSYKDDIDLEKLKELSGAGLTDAKKALVEAKGDFDKALEAMRKKGLTKAEKRGDRETREGLIESYIHDGRLGAIVEVNCETSFVAKTDEFKTLAHQIAMQIASMNPLYVSEDDIPADVKKAKKKELEANFKGPENMKDKILEGQIKKAFSDKVLMNQPYILDDSKTVEQFIKEAIAKTGENITVRQFKRIELGVTE